MYGYRSDFSVVVIEPPAEEPVSLATAKLHCRIDSNEDDALIELAIAAAREQIELQTRRALVTQTLRLSVDVCPLRLLRLPRPPLVSVVQIAYDDASGDEQIYEASPTAYRVDHYSAPGRIILGDGAPCVLRPVRVDYVAGYGPPAKVPAALRQAILLLVGDAYTNREAQLDKPVSQNETVQRLIAPYRMTEFP